MRKKIAEIGRTQANFVCPVSQIHSGSMLQQTDAISLSYIRYKETSIIARFFTEVFGLQSFVVNGVRSSKSKMSPGLFQPLGLVDLIQYHDERKDLHRLKEIRPARPLATIPFSPAKTAIALFVAEYLSKVLKEGQVNEPLFSLCRSWILELDEKPAGFDSLHIHLVWNSLGPLGIAPADWLDIIPPGVVTNPEQRMGLDAFFHSIENGGEPLGISGAMKQWILDVLILYARTHLEGMGTIQSLAVLRQVFS